MTLQAILQNPIFGPNFQNLGRSSGYYLSYRVETGFELKKLSLVERIIRSMLAWAGCYRSTHLKTIAPELVKEANIPPELLAKIQKSWIKTYPDLQFPQPAPVQDVNREPVVIQNPAPVQPVVSTYRIQIGNGAIHLEAGDIVRQNVNAIVNAANSQLLAGGGVCGAIFNAAGKDGLQNECNQALRHKGVLLVAPGDTVRTSAGRIPLPVQHIFHTVGPIKGNQTDAVIEAGIKKGVMRTLEEAMKLGVRSIAFPALSSGIYGVDLGVSVWTTWRGMQEHLVNHPGSFDLIKLVVPQGEKYRVSRLIVEQANFPQVGVVP